MFQFSGFPPYHYGFMIRYMESVHVGFPIRIPADQRLCATPRSFSQLVTSFFGSQCQGIHPALFLLNRFDHALAYASSAFFGSLFSTCRTSMSSYPAYFSLKKSKRLLGIQFLWCCADPKKGTASGDEGIRTPDPLLARQVLSQLSYTPRN